MDYVFFHRNRHVHDLLIVQRLRKIRYDSNQIDHLACSRRCAHLMRDGRISSYHHKLTCDSAVSAVAASKWKLAWGALSFYSMNQMIHSLTHSTNNTICKPRIELKLFLNQSHILTLITCNN